MEMRGGIKSEMKVTFDILWRAQRRVWGGREQRKALER
jgi:hypothetical protein